MRNRGAGLPSVIVTILVAVSSFSGCGGPASGPATSPPSEEYVRHRDAAVALYRQRELRKSLAEVARMLQAEPERREPYEMASQLYVELADDAAAVRFFEIVTRQHPEVATAWQFRGFHEFRQNQWKAALDSYRRASELDPEDSESFFRQGLIHQTLGDFDSALAGLRKAHELAPAAPIPAARLSRVLRITGSYDEAERVVTATLEASPRSADLHYALGQIRLRQGRDEEAEAEFRRSIALDPYRWDAHYDLARLLIRAGRDEEGRAEELRAERLRDYAESRQSLLRLAAARPDDPAVALELAESDVTEGNLAEAERWTARAEQLGAPLERVAVLRAEVSLRRGSPADARAELARLGPRAEAEPRARLVRASLDLAAGNVDAALSHAREAVSQAKPDRALLRRAADVFRRAGRTERADSLLTRAAGTPRGLAAEGMAGMRSD